MSTLKGPIDALADISRLASENVGPWLREYDGYRGTLVLTDQASESARLITLWDDPARTRSAPERHAVRCATSSRRLPGWRSSSFGVFEVVASELLPAEAGAT